MKHSIFVAAALFAVALGSVPAAAETQGEFLRNPANYPAGSYQHRALSAKQTPLFALPAAPAAVRTVARQFEPRQAAANVRAVLAAHVAAADSASAWIARRAREAKHFFLRLGYSPKAASAIAGHLVTESAMQTQVRGDGGYSAGLAQWNGMRLLNLKRFAAARGEDWHDFETQLAFIDHELRTSEALAFAALNRAGSIAEATAAFMHFERPLGYLPQAPQRGHGWSARLYHAQRIYAGYQAELAEAHP